MIVFEKRDGKWKDFFMELKFESENIKTSRDGYSNSLSKCERAPEYEIEIFS